MGCDTGTNSRHSSTSSEDPTSEKSNCHAAQPRICFEEALIDDRVILCDCHRQPMYYLAVSLTPESDCVMCWVSDCRRCYSKSLGYFRLRRTSPPLERIDEDTRSMVLCPNESCSTSNSMAITRADDGEASGEGEICWYCFDCGTELPNLNARGLWGWLLERFRPAVPRIDHPH
jgi:hypothetical protein